MLSDDCMLVVFIHLFDYYVHSMVAMEKPIALVDVALIVYASRNDCIISVNNSVRWSTSNSKVRQKCKVYEGSFNLNVLGCVVIDTVTISRS